jgi:hypothetical protein
MNALLSKISVALFAGIVLPASETRAQTIGGQIFRDTSKAPAPRVVIIAKDSATGRTAVTRASSSGVFYLALSRPGTYGLSLAAGLTPPYSVGRVRCAADEFCDRSYIIAAPEDSVFLESEVDVHVAPMPGNTAPRYPKALRDAGITGEVLGAFVVDTNGRAVRGSFGVLRMTDQGFIETILEALPNFKFYPARRAGKLVVQRVIMPFGFSLTR